MTTPRIGFACKWIDHPNQVNGIKPKDDCKKYNTGATTVAWLNRQSKAVAEQKLWDLMVQNIEATSQLVERVGQLETHLRMVRLSSDLLPVYTEPTWGYFFHRPDVLAYCERGFGHVGARARALGVRLSFHPGQFTVLASENPEVVERSIEEFEYHADMARWMGYGKTFQDFKINVHISGRAGTAGIRKVYPRLSVEARNTITIENEEITYGILDCLSIADIVPIVCDIHHHWVREGEYIQPSDDRVKRVVDSWRGVRPTLHYSISRDDYIEQHPCDRYPSRDALIEQGYKKQKLRAHSDFFWNDAVNDWAAGFLVSHDIMCEAKGKNLASFAFAEHAKKLGML